MTPSSELDQKQSEPTMEEILSHVYGSPIGEHFHAASLETCVVDEYNRQPIAACRQFRDRLIPGIVLSGSMGTGKTHLALATVLDIARAECKDAVFVEHEGIDMMVPPRNVMFWKSDDLASLLREGEYSVREQCKRIPVLVIDDLGVEMESEFIRAAYQSIFDARYESNRSTLITTNLSKTEIDQRYTQRVMSRWGEKYSLFHLGGPDRRRKR